MTLQPSKTNQRPPRPALFQGPPSHNASNLSLPPGLLNLPQGSASRASSIKGTQASSVRHGTSKSFRGAAPELGSPFLRPARSCGQAEIDSGDAVWEEMQSTLAEVELNAASGDHVFGAEHSRALEELRVKQLALAQAWARSEADEVVESSASDSGMKGPESVGRASTETEDRSPHNVLDEKTEKDIFFARKRREANDRYFERVNNSVLDVVAKLNEVANAMRAVERESKEIWSESESISSAVPDG
ncbi:conserved hypothetical protein [Uncinocarpus reesii 1704]|uniref:Uncharacterized protein n=1 Tax=Uncinocarpus reesii (strain UAMH 1704) TaxID=336963 RepID=C4JTI5_UNCRE|nr:uncharacterized protein UREG_05774 [Uncinocarpus reesii 1704]EEP80932.1 conserved hypothetical protein [Uncinocarpus reesii 1704]